MEVDYKNADLRRLAKEAGYTMGLPPQVATKFRHRIQYILAAPDERALYAMQGSLDYKKVKGQDGLMQMRLNGQYRIRLEIHERSGGKVALIVDAGDFHND